MKKYEYLCIPINEQGEKTTEILNEYGKDGWELVCVAGICHYLKREVK